MSEARSKVPSSIQIRRGSRRLVLDYQGAEPLSLPFEYLRVYSPSAEVRGHGAGEGHLVSGKANVMITGAEAVGNYALKLTFDDGHDSGLFTWDYLRTLAEEYPQRWARYLQRLEEAGLGREPTHAIKPGIWQ